MDELEITSVDQLWDWLGINHAQEQSVRLVTWKAAHREKYVSREAVLDALIAHGWIDGRRFVVDADRTAQLIAPRQQQAWAESYKKRVEALRKADRMHPSGEAAVASGMASGLWDFYADVDALIVPDDLDAALNREKWDALAPSYRRNILRWIKQAKTAPTRAKRIASATARGEKLANM